jgi:hypothetical protein
MTNFNKRQFEILEKSFSGDWVSEAEVKEFCSTIDINSINTNQLSKIFSGICKSFSEIEDRNFGMGKEFGKAILIGAGSILGMNLMTELIKFGRGKISEKMFKSNLEKELRGIKNRDKIIKELTQLNKDFNDGDGSLSYENYIKRRNKILELAVIEQSKVRRFSEIKDEYYSYDKHHGKDVYHTQDDDSTIEPNEHKMDAWTQYMAESENMNKDPLYGSRRNHTSNNSSQSSESAEHFKKAEEFENSPEGKRMMNNLQKDDRKNFKNKDSKDYRNRSLLDKGIESAVQGVGSSLGRHAGDQIWYLMSDAVKAAWRKYQDYRKKHRKDLEGPSADKHVSNLYRLKDDAYKVEEKELQVNMRRLKNRARRSA